MKKLAIISTHPIQYNAPLFQLLESRKKIHPVVFYTHHSTKTRFDPGFGRKIEWDLPLTEGYEHYIIENAKAPSQPKQFQTIRNNELLRAVESSHCDAILVFGWNYYNHLNLMRYFKGRIPVYFRGDSTLLDDNPGVRQMLRRQFLRQVYAYVDKAFYVGENNRAYFVAHGLSPHQLVYAPHTIDNARFADETQQVKAQTRQLKQSLNIAPQQKVVLFVGKLESKKAPDVFVEAALQHPNEAVWVLVGNGEYAVRLKERTAGSKQFRFLDFQNQQSMPAVYRLGDVLVLPSRGPGETWGLVLNEAMACGRAVIGSVKAGGAIDLIAPGENGLLIDPNNPIQLANAVAKVLPNSPEMGQVSAQRIKNWSYDHVCSAIEQTLLHESDKKM